jgi:hypothetical protein
MGACLNHRLPANTVSYHTPSRARISLPPRCGLGVHLRVLIQLTLAASRSMGPLAGRLPMLPACEWVCLDWSNFSLGLLATAAASHAFPSPPAWWRLQARQAPVSHPRTTTHHMRFGHLILQQELVPVSKAACPIYVQNHQGAAGGHACAAWPRRAGPGGVTCDHRISSGAPLTTRNHFPAATTQLYEPGAKFSPL